MKNVEMYNVDHIDTHLFFDDVDFIHDLPNT